MSEELEHYGIKGMKWGKRKGDTLGQRYKNAYVEKLQNRVASDKAVLSGNARISDKLARNRFTKKGVQKSADRNEADIKRLTEGGKMKTRDVLRSLQGFYVADLFVSYSDSRYNKPTSSAKQKTKTKKTASNTMSDRQINNFLKGLDLKDYE